MARDELEDLRRRLESAEAGLEAMRRGGAEEGRGAERRPVGRTRAVVLSSVILGLLIAPFGIAATGDALREGVRNGTTSSETEIIGEFNATSGAKGGYVTRQSNTQTGSKAGGAAIYGCRGAAGGTASGSAPCLRASNLATGLAFEFASDGLVGGLISVGDPATPNPAARPFITNAQAVALGLNADKVDGKDASELQGAPGPAGPAGATGPAGPAGPAGPTNVIVRTGLATTVVGGGVYARSTAACQSGERAVGGGMTVTAGTFNMGTTGANPGGSFPSDGSGDPVAAGATPGAWSAAGVSSTGGSNTIQAYAICAA